MKHGIQLYDYLALTNEEQWGSIWDSGIEVGTFKSIDCSFVLYAVEQFYVEVELCPLKGSILGKSAFTHGKRLDKYSGDLSKLINPEK